MNSPESEWTENELLRRCAERPLDDSAWVEFLHRYDATIRGLVKEIVSGHRAEQFSNEVVDDLVQLVYCRLVEEGDLAFGRFAGSYQEWIDSYLATILTNVAREFFRDPREKGPAKMGESSRRIIDSLPASIRSLSRLRASQISEITPPYLAGQAVDFNQNPIAGMDDPSLLIPNVDQIWPPHGAPLRLEQFAYIGGGNRHEIGKDLSMPLHGERAAENAKLKPISRIALWRQMTHQPPEAASRIQVIDQLDVTIGVPQVLLNSQLSTERWQLAAFIDQDGHPVSSRVVVVRPKTERISMAVLWAICNSPIGNAHAYISSFSANPLAPEIGKMPVPDLNNTDLSNLELAARAYITRARAADGEVNIRMLTKHDMDNTELRPETPDDAAPESSAEDPTQEELKLLHWRVDSEVLRLYDLPARSERKILDLFSGSRRRGVPFEQTEYFPGGFTELNRLSELLAITADWQATNRERARLMDEAEGGEMSPEQTSELENLQRLADARVSLFKPSAPTEIDHMIESLERRGLWTE